MKKAKRICVYCKQKKLIFAKNLCYSCWFRIRRATRPKKYGRKIRKQGINGHEHICDKCKELLIIKSRHLCKRCYDDQYKPMRLRKVKEKILILPSRRVFTKKVRNYEI